MQATVYDRLEIPDPVGKAFNPWRCAEIRKAAGFESQQDVADEIEISQGGYAHFEVGRAVPGSDRLFQLSDLFGCYCDAFRQEVGEPIRWLPGRKPKAKKTGDD